jgi:tetratricopeptide (TPR) repeat protein
VIGNVVPAWLLGALTGQPVDGPAQLGLAEQDFIFPGERAGTLRFKHGITRDIIYESVGLHTRQELHLRIAEALKQHSADNPRAAALEALALHYDAGGNPDQAAHYAELAGDRALAASALDRARSLYRVALRSLEKLPQTPSVALRWVSVVQHLGRVSVFDPLRAELDLYVRAVALAERHGSVGDRARARHWLGYFEYGLGDVRSAIRHGERALAEAHEIRDEKLAVQILAALGEAHAATAQYDRAKHYLDEAIAVKRKHVSDNHRNVGLAFSLVARGAMLGDLGRFEEAYGAFDEALACVAGVTHVIGASILGWRAAVLLWQGRWEAATEAAEASARLSEATHSLTQLSIARAMGAYAAWKTSRDPEHLRAIVDATAWLGAQGSNLFRSLNHGWVAGGLAEVGLHAKARRHAARALLRSRQHDFLGVPMAYRALARGAAADRPERVQHYLDLAMKAARQRMSAHEVAVTHCCAAELTWRAGKPAQARLSLDMATTAFREMQMPWHLGEALRLRHLIQESAPPVSSA